MARDRNYAPIARSWSSGAEIIFAFRISKATRVVGLSPNYLPRFSLSGHVCQSISRTVSVDVQTLKNIQKNEASICHRIFVSTRIRCGATIMADSKARFKTRYTSLCYIIALAEVISFAMLLRGHPERVTDGHRQQLQLPQFYPDGVIDNHASPAIML